MGQASRRKRQRKPQNTIRLAGEQAEAFDTQMDADKEMFEKIEDYVYFRPQIPGEWNEQIAIGCEAPMIGPIGNYLPQQCTWTVVVDLVRVHRIAKGKPLGDASGFRTRYKCVPILNAADAKACRECAQEFAIRQLKVLGQITSPPTFLFKSQP